MISDQLPTPDKENIYYKNSHWLLDLRDEFLAHEVVESRRKVFEAIFNVAIMVYDFDSYYRERGDWIIKQIQGVEWEVFMGRDEPREEWWLDFNKYPHGESLDNDLRWLRSEKRKAVRDNDMERAKQIKIIENLVAQRHPRGNHGV